MDSIDLRDVRRCAARARAGNAHRRFDGLWLFGRRLAAVRGSDAKRELRTRFSGAADRAVAGALSALRFLWRILPWLLELSLGSAQLAERQGISSRAALNGPYPSGRVPFVDGDKFVKMLEEDVDQMRVKVLSSFHLDVLIDV